MADNTTILTAVVRKAVKGDTNSKAWLYNQYSKAMFNICVRITGNYNNAEDALQDAFISAYNNLSKLKNEELFGGWLKKIVINECIKQLKKNNQIITIEENTNIHETRDEENWWQNISLTLLNDNIKKLPNGCREIFCLYAIENYSHKQIAEALSISEGTSKSQYHRAKTILKQQITQQLNIHG